MNNPKVPAVENAIRVLNLIATNQGETTSSSLARQIGASQPTTYRILKTLESADWIRQNGEGGYSLSVGLLPLLAHLDDFTRYNRIVQPFLDELSRKLDLTAKFTLRQWLEQIIVSISVPRKPFGVSVPLGGRFPLVWGSPGACLMAGLAEQEIESVATSIPPEIWKQETRENLDRRIEQVRKDGICESFGEHYLGIDTISTPIATPFTSATLTLVGLRGELDSKNTAFIREELISCGQKLEYAIHHS